MAFIISSPEFCQYDPIYVPYMALYPSSAKPLPLGSGGDPGDGGNHLLELLFDFGAPETTQT